MLLTELKGDAAQHHERFGIRLAQRGQKRSLPTKVMGSGAFGTAISQPQDTNSVLKVARFHENDPNKDGYYEFVNRIRELHNPYFPQIDVVKTFKGGTMYKVRMERLTDLNHLSVDDLFAMLEKALGYEPTIRVEKGNDPRDEVFFWMSLNFSQMLTGKVKVPDDADPNFKQAIAVMRKMADEGWGEDIHSGNIMVRRSPYGFQMVFIDPFSHLDSWD